MNKGGDNQKIEIIEIDSKVKDKKRKIKRVNNNMKVKNMIENNKLNLQKEKINNKNKNNNNNKNQCN